eukprot:CAMPEP_0174236868 /NCGR_PEP_ID=MMETSP0417-20130205/6249_1 /TAXON_ID=242541 /ORGANISM="Mayorella sp, Strain BSH-02190019" /LENGTH=105 /DNA_ID=CAMNT_0015315565 /DNA_START=26 /DNA_END=343 /DNA_ORIENTATION=+
MSANALKFVKDSVAQNPLVVFSKSYCPYCVRVKSLFNELGAKATVYELDQRGDGAELQDALGEITGGRSVPRVFIGGNFIGGCDDTMAVHRSGGLVDKLKAAGAL